MKRRDFLKGTSAAALAARMPIARGDAADGGLASSTETFDRDQWFAIAAVQDHLLPTEPAAPGAREANATAYLDRTLADPRFDPEIKGFLLQGIGWLNDLAAGREGGPFHLVEPARREALLQEIARSEAGERWLASLIAYTLEALLADPLYGGNPDGIGWKWLDHDPGHPRPTPDTIYGRLGRT